MYGIMTCGLCLDTKLEGTLLTREQIEEISTRISKSVSENVSKQLEEAISIVSSEKAEEDTKKSNKWEKARIHQVLVVLNELII